MHVVVPLERPQRVAEVAFVPDQRPVEQFICTNRSMIRFIRGTRTPAAPAGCGVRQALSEFDSASLRSR